jgi:hypothetical protein
LTTFSDLIKSEIKDIKVIIKKRFCRKLKFRRFN